MQVVTGAVVEGKLVLESATLPEGTVVTILVKDLEEALDEADREAALSGNELLEKLRKSSAALVP